MSGVATGRALAAQRALLVAVMALATFISWAYLVEAALRRPHHGPQPVAAAIAMWIAMTLGMILPAAAPMCVAYLRLTARDGCRHLLPTAAFVGAYAVLWIGLSAIVGWTQAWVAAALPQAQVSAGVRSSAAGAVLIAAGLYQFSPLKHACLRRCRTPLGFLLTEWRPGAAGGLRLGFLHGRDCILCCWTMVALTFVVGTMNLLWMAALTLLMIAEKCLPRGHAMARTSGAAIVLWGVWQMV